jgi:heme-degrading monooxygenase HmoA
MAIVMTMEAPGATPDQYEALNEALGIDGDDTAPDGLIIHMAGISEDGMVVVDVWESEEKLNAFFTSGGLGQALEESEIEASEPSIHKLHYMIPQGGGSGDNVIVMIESEMTPEMYDSMSAEMPNHSGEGTSQHPVVAHIAAVTDEGKILVFDIWESPEAFGAFAESELAPRADESMGEITPRFVPVHNVLRGKASVTA